MFELGVAWGATGLVFWAALLVLNGTPDRWKTEPRYQGWDEFLLIWLPLSILGGPIWWIVLGAYRFWFYVTEEK